MLTKVYVNNLHPEMVEFSDDYKFVIEKSLDDFTEEEERKAGIEKKIDIAIKDWFCHDNEEWTRAFETITIDEALMRAELDYDRLWDLIQWLRKYCD